MSKKVPLTGEAASAVTALKSGNNLFSAAYGTEDGEGSANETDTTDPLNARRDDGLGLAGDAEDTTLDAGSDDFELEDTANDDMTEESDEFDLPEDEDVRDTAEEESEDSTSESDDSSDEGQPDTEEIEFTDDKGRRTYTIDFKDRGKIKQAFIQAAGMRKAFSERDAERAAHKKTKEDIAPIKEKSEQFDSLSSAWENEGIAGLVRVLSKGQQTWDQLFDAEKKHRETLAAMSPEAKAAYDARQAAAREAAEKARIQKQFDELKKENEERQVETERKTIESYMNTEFSKVRFAGKLGDKANEHRLDKMLYESVKAEIRDLPDDVEVTPQLIRKLYRENAAALQATIKTTVRKETGKAIQKKKVEATKHAQARMTSSQRETTEDADIRKDLKQGNTVSAVMKLLQRGKKKA